MPTSQELVKHPADKKIKNWRKHGKVKDDNFVAFFVFNRRKEKESENLGLFELLERYPDGIRFYLAQDSETSETTFTMLAVGVKKNATTDAFEDCLEETDLVVESLFSRRESAYALMNKRDKLFPPKPIPIDVAEKWIKKYQERTGDKTPNGHSNPQEPKLRSVLFQAQEKLPDGTTITHLKDYLDKPFEFILVHIATKQPYADVPTYEENTETFIISGSNNDKSDVFIEVLHKDSLLENGKVLEYGKVCPPIC